MSADDDDDDGTTYFSGNKLILLDVHQLVRGRLVRKKDIAPGLLLREIIALKTL